MLDSALARTLTPTADGCGAQGRTWSGGAGYRARMVDLNGYETLQGPLRPLPPLSPLAPEQLEQIRPPRLGEVHLASPGQAETLCGQSRSEFMECERPEPDDRSFCARCLSCA